MPEKKRSVQVQIGGRFPIQFGAYQMLHPDVTLSFEVSEDADMLKEASERTEDLQRVFHMATATLAGLASSYAGVESLEAVRKRCVEHLTELGVDVESEAPATPSPRRRVRRKPKT